MNKKAVVKVGAVILAAAMVVPLVVTMAQGSSKKKEASNESIATYEDYSIPEGVYVLQMMSAFSQATQMVEDKDGEVLTQEIDGMPVPDWIEKQTKDYMAENFAIMKEFYARDLALTDKQNEQIKSATEEQWKTYGQSYGATGININAVETLNIINMQASEVFKDMYKDFPEDEAKKFFEENYSSTAYMPFLKINKEGKPLSEDEIAKLTTDADSYLKRIKDGENFEDVISEYEEKYQPDAAKQLEEGEDYRIIVDNDYTYLDPAFITLLNETPVEQAFKFENDQYIIVAERFDIFDDPSDFEQLRDRVLVEIKGDEFTGKLKELAKDVAPKYDKKLVEKYGSSYISAITGIK